MTINQNFGAVLSGLRREHGFASAHQFFKSVGGSRSLGLSFVSYWDIERGKKLPKSWRLKAIMAALGVDPASAGGQSLLRAYFRALSGSDELLDMLAPQAAAGDLTSRELAESAAVQAVAQRSVNLTLDQWKLRARSAANHICHVYIVNTAGWVTEAELMEATGFSRADVRKTLKALSAGGLVELSRDRARSPFVKKVINAMPVTPATAGVKAALRDIWSAWLARSPLVDSTRITFRMTKANLAKYRQHLAKAVDLACLYANSEEDRDNSAVYSVEAGIYQVFKGGPGGRGADKKISSRED